MTGLPSDRAPNWIAPEKLLNMAGNLPPRVPTVFDRWYREAIEKTLIDHAPHELIGAHQFRGSERDRAAGARFVAKRLDEAPTSDRLIVTNGTQSAIVMLMAGLVGRGGKLAVEELSYPSVKYFAECFGIELCSVPMDEEGVVPDAYEKICKESRPTAFYAMPTLQNPTTAIMSTERRQAIAGISRRYGVSIIEDDIYSLLPMDPPLPLSAFAPEISWYILGTAKCIAPALKIAYLVAPSAKEALARFWPGVRATYWMCAPINASVASTLIERQGADEIISAVRRETQARQALVREMLSGADYRAHSEGLQVWLSLPQSRPRAEFVSEVRSLGVEISSSDTFFFGKDIAPNAIRFGTGTAPTRAEFEHGLRAIAQALRR
ncbi:PLP-dependent aminotransferase family protein [Chelatococcus asaccharovorans]|uniref:DNA-binding transcriptional MocR family regulator n=1 Tax=Chelatococcus asaccharovorans TaxID=28210 RepID=A0A2V3U865_9HYPH|nr:PLP-dependent aminotransferase family protein [Chelatococcus asaccharovorans]MBS7705591.1 PLP-dependent aminotransferase family protein [Chelatococcus asaccharovorans]PXW59997.1 DNA-binding transcriptional MocR family regulator [Chelatococcus asaccharovorans]